MKSLLSFRARKAGIFSIAASILLIMVSFQNCSRVEFKAANLDSKQTQNGQPDDMTPSDETPREEIALPTPAPTPFEEEEVDNDLIVVAPTPAPTSEPTPEATPEPTPVATPTPALTFNDTDIFTSETKGKLDIIWVIDNSDSMTEEAEHVRNNFQKFVDLVMPNSDLRVALISKKQCTTSNCTNQQGKNGVTLPAAAAADTTRFKQIDVYVGSNAGLLAVAHTVCPSTSATNSECRKIDSLDGADGDLLEGKRGQLRGFLRDDAKKMLIFVTDDNSALPATQFRTVWGTVYPSIVPSINGFVALNAKTVAGSSCVANKSSAYLDLKTSSTEKMINVCDEDWTSHFDSLATTAVELAKTTYTLEHSNIVSVESVKINGTVVDPAKWSLTGNVVQLDSSLVSAAATYSVEVKYTYKD